MQNQNIMKLLSTLGGGSASYGQGSMPTKNGQPLLQKPVLSRPDALSAFAPGNQGGGVHAALGATNQPNSTEGVKQNEMTDSPTHPISQLAEYLTTTGGHSASAARTPRKPVGTDAAMFIRGGAVNQQSLPGVMAGLRG